MSVQQIKQRIYHLVDDTNYEDALTQLLQNASELLIDHQPATLADLTIEQRARLDKSIQQHKDGKTVSNETRKQRYQSWLR